MPAVKGACSHLGTSSTCHTRIASEFCKLPQDRCREATHGKGFSTRVDDEDVYTNSDLSTCSTVGTTSNSPNAKSVGSEVAR